MKCECCGGSGVVPDEPSALFTRMEAKIWRAIIRRDGISSEQLAAHVYADHPNGGPEYGRNNVVKTIHMMKKKLRGNEFFIQSKRGVPGYRVRKMSESIYQR